ncbi:hypothetical protein VWZ88_06000 [Phaeobacter sp. JH20_36]|uniref:hypothetical protein n=1 Tax=unclassified Phaeobacter TaxID=2621772 RepID=UPI003A8C48DF
MPEQRAIHALEKGEYWPSMAAIAQKSRLWDARSASRIVSRLETEEYVTQILGAGRGKASLYRMNLAPDIRFSETEFDDPGAQTRNTRTIQPQTRKEHSSGKRKKYQSTFKDSCR